MRTLFLAATIAAAYAHLRGWPEGLHAVLRACFAVLALVLGIGLWRRRERPRGSEARAVRAPRWPDYVAVGMGVLAIECLFLFFFSAVPPRAEGLAITVEESLNPTEAATRRTGAEPEADGRGVVSGNWLWDSQGNRQLPRKSNARPSNKPEVFFRPADTATSAALLRTRPYVRAFALGVFADSTWSPARLEAEAYRPDPDGWIRFDRPAARPGAILRGEIYHAAHPGGQDVFTALQGAYEAKLPELRRIAPGILSLNPLSNPGRGYDYQTASQSITFDALLETGALPLGFQLPDDPPAHLVALPANNDELRQAIVDIAIKTQGPIEARLIALRKYLRKNYKYSLEVKNPDDRDPIVNFLLHEKRGHCEFFATAGALLCRALDVPSRIAYGWTGGRYYDAQGLFMFRAREAHAWTEIFLKDVGWVIFDPTPPGAADAAGISFAPPDEKPPIDEDGVIDYDTEIGEDDDDKNLWMWVALGGGLILIPLAILILRCRRKPTAPPGTLPSTLLPDSPGYLARFRLACARLGSPMPPGRTLRQHLAALAGDQRAPLFGEELLEYHYAITYGGSPPSKSREGKLLKAIRRWE